MKWYSLTSALYFGHEGTKTRRRLGVFMYSWPMYLCVFGSSWLIFTTHAYTQIEINLKVKPRTNSEAFLEWNAGDIAPAKRLQMPGMQDFANYSDIQRLHQPAPNGRSTPATKFTPSVFQIQIFNRRSPTCALQPI